MLFVQANVLLGTEQVFRYAFVVAYPFSTRELTGKGEDIHPAAKRGSSSSM